MASPSNLVHSAAAVFIGGLEPNQKVRWLTLLTWSLTAHLGMLSNSEQHKEQILSWLDEWQLTQSIERTFIAADQEPNQVVRAVHMLKILISQQDWFCQVGQQPLDEILRYFLKDSQVQMYLGINRFQEIIWFNLEAFEEFAWWMYTLMLVQAMASPKATTTSVREALLAGWEIYTQIVKAARGSEYQVSHLLESARS